jgi:C4-dicarboxylate transporter
MEKEFTITARRFQDKAALMAYLKENINGMSNEWYNAVVVLLEACVMSDGKTTIAITNLLKEVHLKVKGAIKVDWTMQTRI